MSNYTKTTDFEAKDSLPSGDSGKIIRGSEFETEFDNIATAIATKADAADPTFTGTVTIDGLTVNGNTTLGNAATDTVTVTADIASNLIPSADDTYNLGASGAEWNDLYVDGTAHIDAINFNGTAITATAAELNIMDGVTATTAELNIMDGVTATTTELNYVDGVTSAIQTQLDSKANLSGANFTGSIDVTGTVTADGLTVDGTIEADGTFNPTTSGWVNASFKGTGSYGGGIAFVDGTAGFANYVLSSGSAYRIGQGSTSGALTTHFQISNSGDVSLYEDTGTTAKFFWDSSAERLGIGTTSPANQLDIVSSSTATARIEGGSNSDATLRLTEAGISGMQLKYDGANNLFVIGGGTSGSFTTHMAMTRDGGDVGIGTDSPNANLQIHDTNSAKLWITADGGNPTNAGSLRFAEIQTGGNYFEFLHNGADNSLKLTSTGGDIITFDRDTLNVGIGTSSPATFLHAQRNGTAVSSGLDSATVATFQSTGASGSSSHVNILAGSTGSTGQASLTFGDADDPDIGSIIYRNGDNSMAFTTNTSERMRIDLDGNVFISKTGIDLTTAGIELRNSGLIAGTVDGSYVARLNRNTSDGDLVEFRKDNSTVGTIGTKAGSLFIHSPDGTNGAGLKLTDGAIIPCTSDGTGSDNDIDFGNSGKRFKDLYLSGGAYLGGTAAANKLDDYEEGTFTPALTTDNSDMTVSSYTNQDGLYTKVGDLVTISISLQIGGFTSVGTGSLSITGLPFTPSNAGNTVFHGGPAFSTSAGWVNTPESIGVFGDVNKFRLIRNNASMTATDLGGGAIWLRGTLTYRTAA